nr:EOG090X0AGI [Ilyocryptus agilis]
MAISTSVRTIKEAWNQLHGIVCLYKPARMSTPRLRDCLVNNICRDINQLEPRTPRTYVQIEPKYSDEASELITGYDIVKSPNLADLELVNGPSIQLEDVRASWANTLGWRSSGVVVLGINRGCKETKKLTLRRPLSVYQIKGQFGLATDNHWDDGKVWEKTTYNHLTRGKMDRILASIQASNQRNMFTYCGVEATSDTAYELASKGLLRPAIKGPTLVYSIKSIAFEPPNFTLELHCINESEKYLSTLIHDLGLALKSTAVCQQIRCIRYSCFTVEDALLRKHWSLQYLPDHMSDCLEKLASLPKTFPNFVHYEQVPDNQADNNLS